MVGARFEHVFLMRRNLRRPFPRDFTKRLHGTTLLALTRRGKYLLAALSSGYTVLMHLGMSGSFRLEHGLTVTGDGFDTDSGEPERHDHVVFHMSSGATVFFNDPRRFGSIDLARTTRLTTHASIRGLGPEPLEPSFDAAVLATVCSGRKTAIKVALLDQHVVAGVGNIYASEALHRAGMSPRRPASRLASSSGRPKDDASGLVDAIKEVLNEAIERAEGRTYRSSRFRVYEREGEPCVKKGCAGTIRRITQAGRSTFYCPRCQR